MKHGHICVLHGVSHLVDKTPMGALSVVISSLLSHFLLNEKLSLFGWIASVQCLLGSSILALNGPEEQSVDTIVDFRKLFVTPWFLSYAGVIVVVAIFLAVWVAPRYGRKSMLPCESSACAWCPSIQSICRYRHMQSHWRYQCQLYASVRSMYIDKHTWSKSGKLSPSP